MGRAELLVSTPASPFSWTFLLNPPCLKHLLSSCFESPYQLQDDHERVENDQGQLLDAMDECIFFLKGLNSRLYMKLLLGLEVTWE
ncbi:hypothetical protein YC2023_024975 [Brassica napus]